MGQVVTSRPPATVARIKARFDAPSAEFIDPAGVLVLPHAAMLAQGLARKN